MQKGKTSQVYCSGKKKCFEVGSEGVQRVSFEEEGVTLYRGPKMEKGTGTNFRKTGTRNLEAGSIRSRVESKGKCSKC